MPVVLMFEKGKGKPKQDLLQVKADIEAKNLDGVFLSTNNLTYAAGAGLRARVCVDKTRPQREQQRLCTDVAAMCTCIHLTRRNLYDSSPTLTRCLSFLLLCFVPTILHTHDKKQPSSRPPTITTWGSESLEAMPWQTQ